MRDQTHGDEDREAVRTQESCRVGKNAIGGDGCVVVALGGIGASWSWVSCCVGLGKLGTLND